jgi:uncharacterized protein YdaT
MPWTGATFHRHNKRLTPHASAVAAKIATHALQSGKSEGSAIRIANAAVKGMKRK